MRALPQVRRKSEGGGGRRSVARSEWTALTATGLERFGHSPVPGISQGRHAIRWRPGDRSINLHHCLLIEALPPMCASRRKASATPVNLALRTTNLPTPARMPSGSHTKRSFTGDLMPDITSRSAARRAISRHRVAAGDRIEAVSGPDLRQGASPAPRGPWGTQAAHRTTNGFGEPAVPAAGRVSDLASKSNGSPGVPATAGTAAIGCDGDAGDRQSATPAHSTAIASGDAAAAGRLILPCMPPEASSARTLTCRGGVRRNAPTPDRMAGSGSAIKRTAASACCSATTARHGTAGPAGCRSRCGGMPQPNRKGVGRTVGEVRPGSPPQSPVDGTTKIAVKRGVLSCTGMRAASELPRRRGATPTPRNWERSNVKAAARHRRPETSAHGSTCGGHMHRARIRPEGDVLALLPASIFN